MASLILGNVLAISLLHPIFTGAFTGLSKVCMYGSENYVSDAIAGCLKNLEKRKLFCSPATSGPPRDSCAQIICKEQAVALRCLTVLSVVCKNDVTGAVHVRKHIALLNENRGATCRDSDTLAPADVRNYDGDGGDDDDDDERSVNDSSCADAPTLSEAIERCAYDVDSAYVSYVDCSRGLSDVGCTHMLCTAARKAHVCLARIFRDCDEDRSILYDLKYHASALRRDYGSLCPLPEYFYNLSSKELKQLITGDAPRALNTSRTTSSDGEAYHGVFAATIVILLVAFVISGIIVYLRYGFPGWRSGVIFWHPVRRRAAGNNDSVLANVDSTDISNTRQMALAHMPTSPEPSTVGSDQTQVMIRANEETSRL
ncbi:PREDICTED: uncharacterized protein LOC106811949 [Priapulus caudatus]|uniref:Uncharacterized protein LOC106811949 n=1 Tax=Priapulus caudatus TaxID=37621 RepID=A0ABM1EG60_PRICU|nr:PREDICTED: uncharacterized protein LOC106811949 [Priapulus caudatus]